MTIFGRIEQNLALTAQYADSNLIKKNGITKNYQSYQVNIELMTLRLKMAYLMLNSILNQA
jgi:hypothetical protein